MFDYEKRLAELAKQTVLCVGDLMLDRFVYGEVARISPEAPAPVLAVRREETAPGGAGNVARNIAGLGARCMLVSAVGDDDAGRILAAAFGKTGGQIEARLAIDVSRPTTEKARFVSEHHSTHLLRADWEETHSLPKHCEEEVLGFALKILPECGAVVLSDYGKGVLTPHVIETLIAAARKAKKPVVVDPKHLDYRAYKGATVVTPNRAELSRAAHRDVRLNEDIVDAAGKLIASADLDAILVTRSEEGMTLVSRGHTPVHIPSHPVKVRDVSGAGDTVVATIAAMLAMGAELDAAARVANAAAAVVVGKPGTAAVNFAEMRAILVPSASRAHDEKIVRDASLLDERLDEWRRTGLRIGFTNGCFDLIHPGHLKVLAGARAACDRLVVGLNSDASARRLKGPSRPIQDEVARAEILAALEAVDLVVPFEEDTPLELIRRVKPAVLVKGGDYSKEQVVGREIVEANGGEVVLIETLPERSTTRLVERSKGRG
ncbi:MAG TPA: D-glycero-beta-D-manno-heptose-7-phosphate kinase [Xanthobacteraceae bacterium]|jgi:D-beta-D-heptose 7-phosphate kinase / D-beta-D-heptose 1-phosphate adenosyltransferase